MKQKGDGSEYPIQRNVSDDTALYLRLVAAESGRSLG